jgi:hypothetical protein
MLDGIRDDEEYEDIFILTFVRSTYIDGEHKDNYKCNNLQYIVKLVLLLPCKNEHKKQHNDTEDDKCHANIINIVNVITLVSGIKVLQYRNGTEKQCQYFHGKEHDSNLFPFLAV